MSKKIPTLFVGNVADGKFLEISEDVEFYKVPSFDGRRATIDVEYRRERIRTHGITHSIFVGPQIPTSKAIELIILNYKKTHKE